jgi:hypothetical protein
LDDDQETGDSLVSFIAILTDHPPGEGHEFAEQPQQLRKTVVSLSSLVEAIRQPHGERGRELEAITIALESALSNPTCIAFTRRCNSRFRSLKSNIAGCSELTFDASKRGADHIACLERIAKSQDGGSWQGPGIDPPDSDETQEAALQDFF